MNTLPAAYLYRRLAAVNFTKMTNYEIKKHIESKEREKENARKVLRCIIDLNASYALSESTLSEIEAKVSSRIAQCDISIRDHEKLITYIKCHCDEDERMDCYAECDCGRC